MSAALVGALVGALAGGPISNIVERRRRRLDTARAVRNWMTGVAVRLNETREFIRAHGVGTTNGFVHTPAPQLSPAVLKFDPLISGLFSTLVWSHISIVEDRAEHHERLRQEQLDALNGVLPRFSSASPPAQSAYLAQLQKQFDENARQTLLEIKKALPVLDDFRESVYCFSPFADHD